MRGKAKLGGDEAPRRCAGYCVLNEPEKKNPGGLQAAQQVIVRRLMLHAIVAYPALTITALMLQICSCTVHLNACNAKHIRTRRYRSERRAQQIRKRAPMRRP